MAEAETSPSPENASDGTGAPSPDAPQDIETSDFDAVARALETGEKETAGPSEETPDEGAGDAVNSGDGEADAVQGERGPGIVSRAWNGLMRWHPLVFLAVALGLAAYAWKVYPESEARKIPPAESFYLDGLDRLYRVINPDLPLVAGSPAAEALAARNAFLNLFVFHADTLDQYPHFLNPHLLLAESNRILAEFTPALAGKYWSEAFNAYSAAAAWENRRRDAEADAAYVAANFTDNGGDGGRTTPGDDEIALRRERRAEYIRFRRAEADVNMGHPELARSDLEDLRRREDTRRREELRGSLGGGMLSNDVPRRIFELGADEFLLLDLLLARTYDDLGRLDMARGWYLRFLAAAPMGRNHSFVVHRLADISMADGEVYRKANPEQAAEYFRAASGYYRDMLDSPSSTPELRNAAVLGLADANSRLASLIPESAAAGVDKLNAAGRTVRAWLEDFSGQPLPRRTLALPLAFGETFSKPELLLPGERGLPAVVAGGLSTMAGGKLVTPLERRRTHLVEALENYDRVAAAAAGTPLGDRAAVMAAWEAWRLGLRKGAETRFEGMLDTLADPDLTLAGRLGLATAALDRGELRRAHMLVLGGQAHPLSLWFADTDADWRKIAVGLGTATNRAQPGVWRRLWETIPSEAREMAGYAASGRRLDDTAVARFLRALNSVLRRDDFYRAEDFPPLNRNAVLQRLLDRDPELLTVEDVVWRNRLLLEEAWPYDLARRGSKDVVAFSPFPEGRELTPGGLVDPKRVGELLLDLARRWSRSAASAVGRADRMRMFKEANTAYLAALERYNASPGDILYALANNYEAMADVRELEGRHADALALTAEAGFSYLDVSLKARGSPREMESLLAAGDAFFRAGLLERTVESQRRFLDRFGYSATSGSEGAMAVVRAENLLGRAYWFLGLTDDALEAFRRNIARRTPDRYKSMYYIGRILMDEGTAKDIPELLGDNARPLPVLDRNGDPDITTALEAFNYLRQSPGINPSARAWRWATFDLGRLRHVFADRARRDWRERQAANAEDAGGPGVWLDLYDAARIGLTEALERYPLRRNGDGGDGVSVRVEPEDYADVMASRFETEYLLANTLLVLAEAREDESLYALARAHFENLRDGRRYASALFDRTLDRFQVNAAIIREEVEGGNWDKNAPLPRTRLGDDEGPTHSPRQMNVMLANSMLLLGNEYFRAGEAARRRQLDVGAENVDAKPGADAAAGYYRDSFGTWQDLYDRFGLAFGPESMVHMGDCLARLGNAEDAANHYRMARNMAAQPVSGDGASQDVSLMTDPAFWGNIAAQRLQDIQDGYPVP